MADNEREQPVDTPTPDGDTTTDDLNIERISSGADRNAERDRIRSSNDREQQLERDGTASRRNRGNDNAVQGEGDPIDPDSAFSDVDRDDTIDE